MNKTSAFVRYRQWSRAERQLRKISLHLYIKFFIGHLQPGWTLKIQHSKQALPVIHKPKTGQNAFAEQ